MPLVPIPEPAKAAACDCAPYLGFRVQVPYLSQQGLQHVTVPVGTGLGFGVGVPYLSQHDDSTGVQGQEGAVAEAVLHQQAAHEG